MKNWMELLYAYYKEYGGTFFGSVKENAKYSDCQLILENNNTALLLNTISTYGSKGELLSVKGRARIQTILEEEYYLELRPINIILKGLDFITKKNISVSEELNKNYQIHSNNKEFTKMILPNSSLSQLLLKQKFCLEVYPIKEKKIHMIDITSTGTSQYDEIELTDIIELVEVCKEAYQTVGRYRN